MPFTSPIKRRVSGGGSAPSAGSSGSGGTGDAGGAPSGGGATPGYVDFSRILSANRAGAQGMASQLAGRVQQAGQQASGAVEDAGKKFQGQVQAGTQSYTPTAYTPGPAGGPQSGNLYAAAGAASAQAGRSYTGPKDWQGAGIDTGALTTQAREAGDAARNLATAGGRGALLREQARGPYSAGMSTLDSALAGAALGSRDDELAAQYGNLSQRLQELQAQGGQQVQQATTASEAAAKQAQEEADRYQALGDQAKATEDDAAQYQQNFWRYYQRLAPGYLRTSRPVSGGGASFDPSLLNPGLYG